MNEAAAALDRALTAFPALRAGQVIENALSGYEGKGPKGERFAWDLFYLPDEELAKALNQYIAKHGKDVGT